jgi:hypothetical protein
VTLRFQAADRFLPGTIRRAPRKSKCPQRSAGAAQAVLRRNLPQCTVSSGLDVGKMPEGKMPFYHFDLVNTKTTVNQGGAELHDDVEAMDSADAIARRILGKRPDLRKRHFAILITNEEGREICRLPLAVIH